jgi:cobalt-zinc-cadmium efflux system outer membrane protein
MRSQDNQPSRARAARCRRTRTGPRTLAGNRVARRGREPFRMIRVAAFLILGTFVALAAGPTRAMADNAGGSPFEPESLSVSDVIHQALRRNDRVLAARYMEDAAGNRVAPSGAWDDPMLMAGVANLPTSFDFKEDMMTMTMVGLSQTIPYAGQKGLQARAAKSESQAAAEERRFTEVDVAVAAKIAFFDLFYRSTIVADLMRQREILDQIVESATAKLRTNQAGQDEVLSAQAALWRLDSMILMAEERVDASRYALNSLRGADPESRIVLSARPFEHEVPGSPDTWIETAERTYPPVQALRYRSESYRLSAEAERRMRWPMFTLSASYGWRADTEMEKRGDMVSFYASLSLPLFKGRHQKDAALSMDAMGRGKEAEAAQMRRDIRSEILTLHERAVLLDERLDLYRNRIIPTAEDAYQSALSGYATGRTSFVALLDYALGIIRDSIEANEIENELAMTLAEVERYTWLPEIVSDTDQR